MEKCLGDNKTVTLFMSNNFSVFEPETVPTSKENFLFTVLMGHSIRMHISLKKFNLEFIRNFDTSSTEDLERFRSPFAHSICQLGIHEEHNSLLKRAMLTQPTHPRNKEVTANSI